MVALDLWHSLFQSVRPMRNIIFPEYLGSLPNQPPSLAKEFVDRWGPVMCQTDFSDVFSRDFGDVPIDSLFLKPEMGTDVGCGAHKTHSRALILRACGSKPPVIFGKGKDVDQITMGIDALGGRSQVTVDQYLKRFYLDKYQVLVSPADEVDFNLVGKNRYQKAKERTACIFEGIATKLAKQGDQHSWRLNKDYVLFGTSLMGRTDEETKEGVWKLLEAGAGGVALGSVNIGEDRAQFRARLQAVKSAVSAKQASLGDDEIIPIFVPGVDSLDKILICREEGVQLVSSNLPQALALKGQAVLKPLPGATNNYEDGSLLLDLFNTAHAKDTRPLLDQCKCHACKHHTRAYIHHLLICKELLSQVLLYNHNQHVMKELFASE